MLFLEFIVEVLGEAFDIEGALEALGDIGDGGAAFFVEVGDVHHERGELGEKEGNTSPSPDMG